ncbi:TPA: DUF3037 domain-containing protein [Vibrio vulnificus]|jgi:hypothetical protein|nr:DUF3037 domain-containing protein [Vibrio vulnificus]HDY7498336.1 DUF3037 domain-containing protein [Vibrio vulnificus]
MTRFDFSIIKFVPDAQRGEVLNIGLLVYLTNGVDVRVLSSVSKLKPFNSKLNIEKLEDMVSNIEWVASGIDNPETLHQIFQGELSITKPGYFQIENNAEYEIKVNQLMDKFVNPIRVKKRELRKRITTNIKEVFSKHGVLGKEIDDINDHKVITSYPISQKEGLFAEFLLKNGAYHLTETLDLRTDNNRSKLGESALKALTIDKAKDVFRNNLNAFVIYAADNVSQERNSATQLNLLSEHADHIYNLSSKEDMATYYDHMLTAANEGLVATH